MSYTPFNAPFLSGLLGDMEIAGCFSIKADLAAMLRFELALAEAEAETGVIPSNAVDAIKQAIDSFEPDMPALAAGSARDGMVVPELINQLRANVDETHRPHLHFGSTSQDVIDTSLALRLSDVSTILTARLKEVISHLERLTVQFGGNELMGRTRMQAALPMTAADRLEHWKRPLERHLELLPEINHQALCVQFGGPIGTLEKLGDKADATRAALAAKLGLRDPGYCWHTERIGIVDYAQWLAFVTGSLGKMGQDIVLMAQNELGEFQFDGAGGSSAMAHKQNPVKAEALVTLARFNATLSGGMQHAMIHEQERSGAAWTFEWMMIPQLCVATGASLRNASALLESTTVIGAKA